MSSASTKHKSIPLTQLNKHIITPQEWSAIPHTSPHKHNTQHHHTTSNKRKHTAVQQCNDIILNWLTVEGLSDVAQSFITESHAHTAHTNQIQSIDVRMDVKRLLLAGEVDQAIRMIDTIDPTILTDKQNNLSYLLHKQQLIQLIKRGAVVDDILQYAEAHVLVWVGEDATKLNEIECIMSLLACTNINDSPYASYAQQSYVYELSSAVNNILIHHYSRAGGHESNGHDRETVHDSNELVNVLQQLHYYQQQLSQTHIYPVIHLADTSKHITDASTSKPVIDVKTGIQLDCSTVHEALSAAGKPTTHHTTNGSTHTSKHKPSSSVFIPASSLLFQSRGGSGEQYGITSTAARVFGSGVRRVLASSRAQMSSSSSSHTPSSQHTQSNDMV